MERKQWLMLREQNVKYGLECENFDLFFSKQIEGIGNKAKEQMPKSTLVRLFKRNGEIKRGDLKLMPFVGKLWVLWKFCRKSVFVVVEDTQTGMSPEEFCKLKEAVKLRDMGVDKADGFTAAGTFVTGSKELCDTFDYLNGLSTSPAYNYLNRVKGLKKPAVAKQQMEVEFLFNFLRNYEMSKRKWASYGKLNLSEWYVLMALYDKVELKSVYIHRDMYHGAFQGSINMLKRAFRTLESKGFVKKNGGTSNATLRITPTGREAARSILIDYIANY